MKAKQKRSQAAMIRALLAKKIPAEKIIERVKKAFGGEPTMGYVNWIAKRAKWPEGSARLPRLGDAGRTATPREAGERRDGS